MFVDAGIVGPVRIDDAAGAFEIPQHRKRPCPGHPEEIDAEPQRGESVAHLANEGQQPLEREIVIDEKDSVRAFACRDLRVSNDLPAVQRVNDRQHCGPHRLESLAEFESVHGTPSIVASAISIPEHPRIAARRRFLSWMHEAPGTWRSLPGDSDYADISGRKYVIMPVRRTIGIP